MRYMGNKSKLLYFIENVIKKHEIEGEIFADLFAGTCSVGDYFKGKYQIIANDYMAFSSTISKAKLLNKDEPEFKKFKKKYSIDPFEWLNKKEYSPQKNYFVYFNYSPIADRMYLTEKNSIKIDGMRLDIEEIYKKDLISEVEYAYLIASLLGCVLKVSNTSGTYQAYFKFWEQRALKDFHIEPLKINKTENLFENIVYNKNTNKIIREISGDIAYIDPPYTTTQYTNSYHILETITRYDYPDIFGKTGRRSNRELSGYSNKKKAIEEFEDLFRQIQFTHVLVSYSNQSIIQLDELVEIARKFAVEGKVYIETCEYREYATNNSSYKGEKGKLNEIIIYFKKNLVIKKSPLNYSGSKDMLLPALIKQLPKHIDVFVDTMGGAFNVGANITAMKKVVYNEYNPYVYGIIKMLIEDATDDILKTTRKIVNQYDLKKKNKDSYINLRNEYNSSKQPIHLFVLQMYAFQNMIRFNNSQKMNTPVGNNEFCKSIEERIIKFKVNSPNYTLICGGYQNIDIDSYPEDTLFYFDPPYFITNAEYNDGRRGLDGWDSQKETELIQFILEVHMKGYKFMLSNVLKHNGKEHHILLEWIEKHSFNVINIGKTGIKYPREEVVITNYSIY